MSESAEDQSRNHPHDSPDQESLNKVLEHISSSGALGRSKVYAKLLAYLLQQTQAGTKPKEIEIAMDVLGRSADFDVSKDSLVRVYVYQLRKKLDKYYRDFPDHSTYRLSIPKGQYALTVLTAGSPATTTSASDALNKASAAKRFSFANWCLSFIAALLAMTLLYTLTQERSDGIRTENVAARQASLWRDVLDDQLPILVVMGDYYIFGELNELGDVDRMIRDFSINSSQDLQELFLAEREARKQFIDLNLNYLPEGSAAALANIVPLLQQEGKRVVVTMMSKLNTADLKNNHIVYIGYVSGLDKLQGLVFASSKLQIGRTYDELFNRQSGDIYSSDAGLPTQNAPFRDYGLLTTFPGTGSNQVIIIAGTRDAGLMHTAQAAASAAQLARIRERLSFPADDTELAYEALFEVFGFDRLDFDANLVYANRLDPGLIWSGETRNFGLQ